MVELANSVGVCKEAAQLLSVKERAYREPTTCTATQGGGVRMKRGEFTSERWQMLKRTIESQLWESAPALLEVWSRVSNGLPR